MLKNKNEIQDNFELKLLRIFVWQLKLLKLRRSKNFNLIKKIEKNFEIVQGFENEKQERNRTRGWVSINDFKRITMHPDYF